MKILQVNKFFYLRAGAERYFLELTKLLEGAGHEVIPFAMQHPQNLPTTYSRFFVSESHFDRAEGFKKDIGKIGRMMYSLEAKKKLEELICHERPDIAHLHNIYHQISPSILGVLRRHKIPVVMTLHDYKLVCPNYRLYTEGATCERCRRHKYWNAITHNCMGKKSASAAVAAEMALHHSVLRLYEKKVNAFISPSLFLKELCERWGWTAKKFIYLPYFVDPADISAESEAGDYVLYFGRLAYEKGLDVLLRAAKSLPEVKFKITGTGPLLPALSEMAKRHGALNVEFLPHQYGDDLWKIVAGARLVVLPSVWYENYPLSLLEAQVLGKPIVASRIGGIPEIVREGRSGLLFTPGDPEDLARKIKSVYHNNQRLAYFGHEAKLRVYRENEPRRHLEEILKLYDWVIKNFK